MNNKIRFLFLVLILLYISTIIILSPPRNQTIYTNQDILYIDYLTETIETESGREYKKPDFTDFQTHIENITVSQLVTRKNVEVFKDSIGNIDILFYDSNDNLYYTFSSTYYENENKGIKYYFE